MTLPFPPPCQLREPPCVLRGPGPGRLRRGVAEPVPVPVVLRPSAVPCALLPHLAPDLALPARPSPLLAPPPRTCMQFGLLGDPPNAPQRAPYPLRCPGHALEKKPFGSPHSYRGRLLCAVLALAQPQNFGSGARREGERVFMVSGTSCSDGKGSPSFTPHPSPACHPSSAHPGAAEPPLHQLFLFCGR